MSTEVMPMISGLTLEKLREDKGALCGKDKISLILRSWIEYSLRQSEEAARRFLFAGENSNLVMGYFTCIEEIKLKSLPLWRGKTLLVSVSEIISI